LLRVVCRGCERQRRGTLAAGQGDKIFFIGKKKITEESNVTPCLIPPILPKFHYQKEDFPSHQNVGKYMEY
jgi:hypothetical protein